LSLPQKRKSLDQKENFHFRQADKELLKKKIKFFPLTLGPMRALTKRGMKLKKILEKRYKVIEVFPGATQDILNLPRKNQGIKKLYLGLKKMGIKINQKKLTHDELDAVCCALTGFLFLKGKALGLGDEKEGQIIVPEMNDSR
jgi:predicted nuclease with RNAse H fold